MLHPVGDLPASVYWRRRAMVVGLAFTVLGGGGWLTVAAASGDDPAERTPTAGRTASPTSAATPALERVVPQLASVQVPSDVPPVVVEPDAPAAPATSTPTPAPAPPGPCTDDMITVAVTSDPASAAVGSGATFTLVVANTSPDPCVRDLDKGLQEVLLLDSAGVRVWGSNDCVPEVSADTRTLAPGESAGFPLTWSGLSSEPGCVAPRARLAAGSYLLRARLDTAAGADTPFTLA